MNPGKNNNYYYFQSTTSERSLTTEEKSHNITDIDQIDIAIEVWNDHIGRLEAKLTFLIGVCDDNNPDILYQHEKKIATLKREISDAMEQRQMLIGRDKLVLLSKR